MSDILMKLHGSRLAGPFARALGLPKPVALARVAGGYEARPFEGSRALLLAAAGGYAADALRSALEDAGASVAAALPDGERQQAGIVVMDATGCRTPADYRALYDAFHPIMRRIARNGRVLVTAPLHGAGGDPLRAAVARGIEGFSRSLGKELGRKGICVNTAYVADDATGRLAGLVRFFCGAQATYVSGQSVRVTARVAAARPATDAVPAALPWQQVMAGKTALVTGGARGIGKAIVERLSQEGARVICLDVAGAAEELRSTCAQFGAIPLTLDIAAPGAPAQLAEFLRSQGGGLDILVHNAGITRDRTLSNMQPEDWDLVVNINFAAIAAIDKALLSDGLLRDEGRIVYLSSISGVAGNFGQTNYAATKAALIGYAAAQAPLLAPRGICVNAIAPGFIETAMTAKLPFFTREVGSRLNALMQAGQPRDASELVAFLCSPGACGVSGETIRVCGQGMMGA
ncbi:3-ketoacyl-ACP reductase [Massilia sp. Root418]|jgi:3-oxoacyl-[acyl-carrier protein] reductase|uniref:3-oxoacyl-ACP reductase n=1 Tax=Massilia sp. Root418 TaxID=1736532 RepID=UPI0006F89720|nr:3-oxoacyl-ACP reductase [Massilia sp. Root418]KQW93540.1 3-ketoacyl-ACP reductase [Massilia sp. Root418]